MPRNSTGSWKVVLSTIAWISPLSSEKLSQRDKLGDGIYRTFAEEKKHVLEQQNIIANHTKMRHLKLMILVPFQESGIIKLTI